MCAAVGVPVAVQASSYLGVLIRDMRGVASACISIGGEWIDCWFIYLTHLFTLVTVYTTCCDIREFVFWPH
jgi:hypothetical protein